MAAQCIRPLALCVFHHNGKILVNQAYDKVKEQHFFRPIGGGIEFGELSAQTVVREVREELGVAISGVRLLGTLESLFMYDGTQGHEIVQIYDADFDDSSLYQQPHLNGHETDGMAFTASWHDSSSFTHQAPLVPVGLYELLKKAGLLD